MAYRHLVWGGGRWQPGLLRLTPPQIRKFVLSNKMKFIKRARNWRLILGSQTFFFGP